jgi:hypothetical protein
MRTQGYDSSKPLSFDNYITMYRPDSGDEIRYNAVGRDGTGNLLVYKPHAPTPAWVEQVERPESSVSPSQHDSLVQGAGSVAVGGIESPEPADVDDYSQYRFGVPPDNKGEVSKSWPGRPQPVAPQQSKPKGPLGPGAAAAAAALNPKGKAEDSKKRHRNTEDPSAGTCNFIPLE